MILAIFDLDNTLLGGDSDHSWGEFLVEKGIVDRQLYKTANDQFYADYLQGQLDIARYLSFALEPVSRMPRAEREALHREFMDAKIEPLILPKALSLIEQHRQQGHTLLIITATNRFITEPIARRLRIDNLLATDGEMLNDHYTGKLLGTPCYQEGKITRLNQWLDEQGLQLDEVDTSYFYSDSFNDLPLLKQVTAPFAVDPDSKLRLHAEQNNWPIISLR